jgi:ubiquinone/menaquinone biosynthesis C-methylase UbiE
MWIKRSDPYALLVSMTGVKMGDRLIQVGCANGGRLAAIASKVGLSGRAVAIAPDADAAARASKGAADAGVLIDVVTAPPTRLPAGGEEFDLAVVDDTGDLVGSMTTADRAASVREVLRVLRPGGRVIVLGAGRRQGLSTLFKGPGAPSFTATGRAAQALEADGFRSVRMLAEREGLVFVEGIKAR